MVTLDDVLDAQRRLEGVAVRTPVLEATIAGVRTVLKCENRQATGSFKIRGAYNCASRFASAELERGLVAISSGNHAQAVARTAQILGTSALIAMPEDSSELKLEATRELGAEIVSFDRFARDREDVLREVLTSSKRCFVPPYDHPHVIAGQGTATLELLDDAGGIDVLVVPVSGGGLIAGSSIAAKGRDPAIRIVGVEPEAGDDTKRSFAAERRIWIEAPRTIADGLRCQIPGEVTFPINRRTVDEIVTVSDDEIREALSVLAGLGEKVEPSGAVGVAALMVGRVAGRRPAAILSGGNV